MCFGPRGNPNLKDKSYYSQARRTAEMAMSRPFFITIGGGKNVPRELDGRILELVKSTGVYGETSVFVKDRVVLDYLRQWPVAVVMSEIYQFLGEPHFINDLYFGDRTILTNAYDGVIRDEEQIETLWNKLRDWRIARRWEVRVPPGFYNPGEVQLCGSRYPQLQFTSVEGKRLWKQSLKIERDSRLRRQVIALNRSQNSGLIVCESCGFSDKVSGMFDAHHLHPLAIGERESRIEDLAVLCPTCHRWAHTKANDKLDPISAEEVSRQRAAERLGDTTK